MIAGKSRQHRARWALSFADLCMLLLGFFALLQANQNIRDQALVGIGNYFGALESPQQNDLVAFELFEPGEALLSAHGRNVLLKAARPFAKSDQTIHIQSIGIDEGDRRFDAWDLAAARLGAVARTLVEAGIPASRLRIAGLAEKPDASSPGKQIIRIAQTANAPQ